MAQWKRLTFWPVAARHRGRGALLAAALGLGLPPASVAQVPMDGQWTGVDSAGAPVTFIVSGGGTRVSGFTFTGSCLGGLRLVGESAVSTAQFAFEKPTAGYCVAFWSATGHFASALAASGTTSTGVSPGGATPCFCSAQRTWTAAFLAPGGGADLVVTNTDGRTVASPGALTTYTIEVTNKGPSAVTSFRLVDTPSFVEPSPSWSVSPGAYDPSSGLWTGPARLAGETVVFQLTGHLAPIVAGEIENQASVSTIGVVDPDPGNDSAFDRTAVRTLAIQMVGSTQLVTLPSSVVLTISLANQGLVAADNTVVNLSPPAGVLFSGNTGACTTPYPCSLGTFPADPAAAPRIITSVYDIPLGYSGPSVPFLASATTSTPAATALVNLASWGVNISHPGPPARFHPLEPCRLLDTRSSTAIAAGATRTVPAVGVCGVPAATVPATVRALALNVTVVQPAGDGDLRIYPLSSPLSSTINFSAGQTRANSAVIALGEVGDLTILAEITTGSVHVILDVSGYFE